MANLKCPRCGSEHISIERRPDGYTTCLMCSYRCMSADWGKVELLPRTEELVVEKMMEINQLKTDLENAVRRGDELFDQLENERKELCLYKDEEENRLAEFLNECGFDNSGCYDLDDLKTRFKEWIEVGNKEIENTKKENNSLIDEIGDIDSETIFLKEELAKKDEIIKELEESNEFYANRDNWVWSQQDNLSHNDSIDHEDVDFFKKSSSGFYGGKLAREKKRKVEALRNEM